MFFAAKAFNRDLSKWNLHNAVTTNSMFIGAGSFNQRWCSIGWDGKIAAGAFAGTINSQMKCCNSGRRHFIYSTHIDCESCLPGTFSTDRYETSCQNCPSGWSQSESETQYCLPCVPGQTQHLEGQNRCNDCTIGTFMNKPFANVTECEECEMGKYQDQEIRSECKDCKAGKWSRANAATSESTCMKCGAGTYSSAEGVKDVIGCTGCPPGKASSETGNTKASDCIKCQGNTVAENSGMMECTTPETGFVVLAGGAAAVSKCFSFFFNLSLHSSQLESSSHSNQLVFLSLFSFKYQHRGPRWLLHNHLPRQQLRSVSHLPSRVDRCPTTVK